MTETEIIERITWRPIATVPKGDHPVFRVRRFDGYVELAWTNWNVRPGVRSQSWEESVPHSILNPHGHAVRVGDLSNGVEHTHWALFETRPDKATEEK